MPRFRSRKILCLLVAFAFFGFSNAEASEDKVIFLGNYSNISSSDEHCDGWNIELWQYKQSLVGMIHHHRGLCGDPPAGLVENVNYHAVTGALSFWAKISEGETVNGVPSKDLLHFEGKLTGSRLVGDITWLNPDKTPQHSEMEPEKIDFPRKKAENYQKTFYSSLDAWKKDQQRILDFRGPKW